MLDFPIDFVFPYVDNTKDIWRESYRNYCSQTNQLDKLARIDTERYFDLGLLKYIFRGIDKYMSWIRTIHLIVSDEQQVPEWVDTEKVHIVLHKDIIPEPYLPTFNSTCIEMFLSKIPGLAEHFIYSNDDFYPVNYMQPEDFFTDKGFPRNILERKPIPPIPNQYRKVCIKSYRDVATALGSYYNSYDYILVAHNMHPMLKKHCKEVLSLLGNKIYQSLSTFRTENNYNQYIYINYAYLKREMAVSNIKFTYHSLGRDLNLILGIIKNRDNQQIALNDTANTDRGLFFRNKKMLEEAFDSIGLGEKSKYEL